MSEYVNGIVIEESSGEIRTITTGSQSVIGLVGTAPHAAASLEANVPKAFRSRAKALADVLPPGKEGETDKGTLYGSLLQIYEQGGASVVVVRAASDSNSDVMTAIDALLTAESATGLKPKILAAPGHSGIIPAAVNERLGNPERIKPKPPANSLTKES
ncbi:hypothetical protein [Pseudobacteriovorax antillogorgiicola]|uniref:Phage tail sheath protein n=1 Tax=Pseudobacteriovorax antillogorgiicola TaxID=1513793 RepID=A0A1Y6CQP6_9BACT|nr:hypothetical protein [Pseudobacteriovorax antillogorgiicola]TCS51644.1 hypothetical protein EDD56_11028 [Pseudobacteriovorax antillogorgiicola]SMF81651.1 hypothetical protein SAMN06296036_13728 [Pseudobacteriovorax antillogorgiicola]